MPTGLSQAATKKGATMTGFPTGMPVFVAQPLASHSTEVEHRLTVQEQFMELQKALNEKVDKRMSLMERGLIIVVMVLHALAHEKLPGWAQHAAKMLKLFGVGSH